MPLPAFLLLLQSFGLPLRGRQIMAQLIVRHNFIKGTPLKAAAYWYSVFKFPTFRRKACNKHTKSCSIFLGIKIPICRNHGYVCSYFGFTYMKHLKTGKKRRTLPCIMTTLSLKPDHFCMFKPEITACIFYTASLQYLHPRYCLCNLNMESTIPTAYFISWADLSLTSS